jgi:peptidoglycan/LPS O-acetylase OafA/YrhL
VPALDGLRGLSLPGTIYTHYAIFLQDLPTAPSWLRHAGPFTLNIEMFFVLSGALITSLLVSEHQRTGTVSLKTFYLRRSRRLGPALIAVVPLLLIAQFAVHGPGSPPLGTAPWLTAVSILLFIGNWRLVSNGVGLGWMGPAWTLGIEEQFYLTWPALLVLALRRGWPRRAMLMAIGLVILVAVAFSTIAYRHFGWMNTYYMTPTHLPPILLGCALGYALTTRGDSSFARLLTSRLVALAGLGGMVAVSLLWATDRRLLDGGGYVLYGAAACLLIGHCFVVADRPSIVSRVLGWRPFVVIGQVSYEAYLIHCVVILAVVRARPTMPVTHMIVLDTALIVAISGVFYYFIERPIRRRGWRVLVGRSRLAPRIGTTQPG